MTHIEVPSELPNILRNFTLSVLRTKPRDIIDHAVEYFTLLQRQQQQQQQSEPPTTSNNPVTTATSASISSTSQQSQHQQILNHNVVSSGSYS